MRRRQSWQRQLPKSQQQICTVFQARAWDTLGCPDVKDRLSICYDIVGYHRISQDFTIALKHAYCRTGYLTIPRTRYLTIPA